MVLELRLATSNEKMPAHEIGGAGNGYRNVKRTLKYDCGKAYANSVVY
jgi:hypothetical protein